MFVFAEGQENVESFVSKTIGTFVDVIINPLIIIGFTISFLIFFWGVIEFLAQGNNPQKASAGKQHMFWGIIGLFIFISSIALVSGLSSLVSGPNVFQQ